MSSNLPSEQLHCLFLFVSLVVVQCYEELGKFRELNPASPLHVHLVDHVLHLVVCGVLAQGSQHQYQLLHMRVLALKYRSKSAKYYVQTVLAILPVLSWSNSRKASLAIRSR